MTAKRGAARRAGPSRSRPRLLRTLVSTALLVVLGFGAGLVVGALWETPELILGGAGEPLPLAVLASPGGDTLAPAGERLAAPQPGEVAAPETGAGRAREPAAEPAAVSAAPPAESGPFVVQVGSFTEPVPAWKLAEELGEKHYEVYVDEGDAAGRPRWRVRVGPVATRGEARRLADRLKADERLPTWILPAGEPERPGGRG